MSDFPTEFSPTLGALAKALSKSQGELKDAVKDGENPAFKNNGKASKFATLSSVRAAITPVFSKYGLAVTQLNEPHGDAGVCVVTMLMHESGEWLRSRLFVPVSKKDAQGFGSALSYARRYALASIANIASDDDDDAADAVKPGKAETKPAQSAPAAQGVDVDALVKALTEAGNTEALAKAILAVGRVKDKLTKEQLKRCTDARDLRTRDLEGQEAAA
jgi:hypothetical protein